MEHSILAPSSAARWLQCPGSVKMCQQFPDPEDSPKAAEGALAHAVNVAFMEGNPMPAGATDEMIEGAQLWADTVGSDDTHLEERVDCSYIHPECWGTPDAWSFSNGVLRVYDYKFGHRYVDAYRNAQMTVYTAGLLTKLGIDGLGDQHVRVEMTIVQPRSYHRDGPIRAWSVVASDLRGDFNAFTEAATRALGSDPQLKVGSECNYCSARHACPALQRAAYVAAEFGGDAMPFDLPDAAIGRELRFLREIADTLNSRISGLEDEVLARITKLGRSVPGWMTEQGMGREKWAKPVDEILALGALMGIDLAKPGALTPKQAIKAGVPAAVVKEYIETPRGEVKLIPDASVARMFNGNSQ